MKYILICLMLFLTNSISFCQEHNVFKLNSLSLNYSFLLSPNRLITLPNSVRKGDFFQTEFGNFGKPDRIIEKEIESFQVGLDAGFKINAIKKLSHEIKIGIGRQFNQNFNDYLSKRELMYDSSSGYIQDKKQATVNLSHSFNEIFINTSFIVKTNFKVMNFYTGIGGNFSFYKDEITVSEQKDSQINSYIVNESIQFAKLMYFPCGIEFNILNKSKQGVILGLQSLFRLDPKLSSGFSILISYKL